MPSNQYKLGDAITHAGRKWTIGRDVEITKDNKKFEFKFDEITGGSSKYSPGYHKLTLKQIIVNINTGVQYEYKTRIPNFFK